MCALPVWCSDNMSMANLLVKIQKYRQTASCFYPTAFKSCVSIVFLHGVRVGGQAGAQSVNQMSSGKKFVWAVSRKL